MALWLSSNRGVFICVKCLFLERGRHEGYTFCDEGSKSARTLKAVLLSYALEVIQAINGSHDRAIDYIWKDIEGLARYFECIAFSYIPGSHNGVAHNFAKMSYFPRTCVA